MINKWLGTALLLDIFDDNVRKKIAREKKKLTLQEAHEIWHAHENIIGTDNLSLF